MTLSLTVCCVRVNDPKPKHCAQREDATIVRLFTHLPAPHLHSYIPSLTQAPAIHTFDFDNIVLVVIEAAVEDVRRLAAFRSRHYTFP